VSHHSPGARTSSRARHAFALRQVPASATPGACLARKGATSGAAFPRRASASLATDRVAASNEPHSAREIAYAAPSRRLTVISQRARASSRAGRSAPARGPLPKPEGRRQRKRADDLQQTLARICSAVVRQTEFHRARETSVPASAGKRSRAQARAAYPPWTTTRHLGARRETLA